MIESEATMVKARHLQQLTLVCAIALAMVEAAAAQAESVALPGCNHTCGNVTIRYPFGTGKSSTTGRNCFFDESFELACENSTLLLGNVTVTNISHQGQLEVSFFVSSVCYDASGIETGSPNSHYLWVRNFTISSEKNKFFTVGCDAFGYLSYFKNDKNYSTGCITQCVAGLDGENNETCSGIGCCPVEIPLGMNYITTFAYSLTNYTGMAESFNRCSYSFVHKSDGGFGYKLSAHDVKHGLQFERAPMVLDWAIGTENGMCNACRSNSYCNDTQSGYRCFCKDGYEGNPYLLDGCQDINECDRLTHTCTSKDNCRNTNGSFECSCKKGYSGKGTKEAECRKENLVARVVTIASAVFIVLLIGMSVIYMVYQKRKLVKLKEKFFRQNGGFILQQKIFVREDSSHGRAQIFTSEELKKATKNFDESLIIGKGGYGTVFKGFLADNRIVAVKKSKIVDQSQIEQFINEVVILSQINHRNVVKLLGCCLETEVPLLVYEFVNNGTLYDYIHNESKAKNVSWKTRLRIAAEAAGALAYLHSAASIPIIHRDVKTANILLNETYTAKVSDFGASRLVPIDHAEIVTMVQGTIGYLDPEYMQTSQLTEKSDVYSFGVVLVELLTGEKAFSFVRPEEKRSLSMHFLLAFKEGCLFEVLESGIVNEENKEEVMEVAALASKCLRLIGEERPSMKEVAMELEGTRKMIKHPWDSSNTELNLENEYLLHEKSGLYKHGESSSHQNTGHDSIGDHVLIPLDDGR